MRYILGLDTGGTFTDAAIINGQTGALLAKAKAPTTRHDLSIGLGQAINRVVDMIAEKDRPLISRVCLSTTLATNAVVEGMGGRVGLVMIGFDQSALERNNLGQSLGEDPVTFITGGHKSDARQQAPLDIAGLDAFAATHGKDISAIAIAGHFAVRNPEHEALARDHLREATGLPVTCSHELSSSLGGPKRALTALLNARLIDLLDRQIAATDTIMAEAGLDQAELMVVKGDGSLVGAEFARLRPVETILSGPAASLSGAAHLVGRKNAIVADIGGTTTDIAILEGGFPRLSPRGATIGGWSTMVEAADIRTGGLGGDSEVRLIDRGTKGGVLLGPRRVIPLCMLAEQEPRLATWLESQIQNPVATAQDGRFVVPLFEGEPPSWLTRSEANMARQCRDTGIAPVADLAQTRLALSAIDRLVARGLLAMAAFTPTDAARILGKFDGGDLNGAVKGGELMARQRTGGGVAQASSPEAFSMMVMERLTVQSALALLDSAFAHQGMGEGEATKNRFLEQMLASASHLAHGGSTKTGLVSTRFTLEEPLVALGASAACHYPAIATAIGAELIVPEDADVAGAVGAAAGSIRQRAIVTVTQPADGVFRVHTAAGPEDFSAMDLALNHAEDTARNEASHKAEAAGATAITVDTERQVNLVDLGGDKTLFIEARITGIATGMAG
ncbi:MAG: hydantoinase/oxoprolinase N-terminal domain-containing protein [Candidatus Puniceispirillales bacterium]